MKVVTRFAPSPTGDLHLGGARTALYSWLYARQMQGKFILRIEDSDSDRSTSESVTSIISGMQWLGLNYDEGPFYQSNRLSRYQEVIGELLANGYAYKCYCTPERLEKLRMEQMANKYKPRYDGYCRDHQLVHSGPYVVRFKNPQQGEVSFHDMVRGKLTFSNNELDDLIISRSNGMPTYNLSVVIDDYDMQVTHVIRGDDHINNTPRQINILSAFNAKIPVYVHLPMILGENGQRLSKRDGAASVLTYRDAGILPIALLNYLVRLGWSHGDQEIFSLAEMLNYFTLDKISRSSAALNPKKLLWLNHAHIKSSNIKSLIPIFKWHCNQINLDISSGPNVEEVIALQIDRAKTLHDMVINSIFFYQHPQYSTEMKCYFAENSRVVLQDLIQKFTHIDSWTALEIMNTIKQIAASYTMTVAQLSQLLRVVLTGQTVSPSIDKTIYLLSQETFIYRLQRAVVEITK